MSWVVFSYSGTIPCGWCGYVMVFRGPEALWPICNVCAEELVAEAEEAMQGSEA
ncbi:MAG: hypothetical protein KGI71_05245 [Patescibacteria group bacterium]|nr:hypothetical protein [Patescibacteria group bacterium]